MRRADRLFQIVQHFRGGRLVTAQKLGAWLEVSERTIYRDIADLQSTGVPIDGEAGVGYMMREGFDLPPLMFTRDEIVALVTGARLARAWGGIAIANAAQEALVKIEAVLPETERRRIARTQIHAPHFMMPNTVRELFDLLERAADERKTLAIDYADADGSPTTRQIRPLALLFWGKVWTLAAWCEMRNDFRTFRIDRMVRVAPTGETFRPERGRMLSDYYRRVEDSRGGFLHDYVE